MIDKNLFDNIISNNPDIFELRDITERAKIRKKLIQPDEIWLTFISTLSQAKLLLLIKGIVLLGKNWGIGIGGSVSPTIILYKHYILLYPEDEKELTDWILNNRVSKYDPYGTIDGLKP